MPYSVGVLHVRVQEVEKLRYLLGFESGLGKVHRRFLAHAECPLNALPRFQSLPELVVAHAAFNRVVEFFYRSYACFPQRPQFSPFLHIVFPEYVLQLLSRALHVVAVCVPFQSAHVCELVQFASRPNLPAELVLECFNHRAHVSTNRFRIRCFLARQRRCHDVRHRVLHAKEGIDQRRRAPKQVRHHPRRCFRRFPYRRLLHAHFSDAVRSFQRVENRLVRDLKIALFPVFDGDHHAPVLQIRSGLLYPVNQLQFQVARMRFFSLYFHV